MFEKVDGETEYFDEQTERYHSNHSKQESLIYLAEEVLKMWWFLLISKIGQFVCYHYLLLKKLRIKNYATLHQKDKLKHNRNEFW